MNRESIEQHLRAMGIVFRHEDFTGSWVNARCPFAPWRHERGTDNSPSFGISTSSPSRYNCFTCKSTGLFSKLPGELSALSGNDYGDLGNEILLSEATSAVLQPDSYEAFEEIEPLPEEVYGDLFPSLGRAAQKYLRGRGIDPRMCHSLGVRDWPEDQMIMFPVRGFDGALYGWAGRTYEPGKTRGKTWNTPGMEKSCHLLGAHRCDCTKPIILVEGQTGWARFYSLGVPYETGMDVLAVMGSVVSDEQGQMLAEIGKPVYLFLDGDKAGQEGVWGTDKKEGAVHLLSRAIPTYTVRYPTGIKDPDDLTSDQIYDMIQNAEQYVRRRRRG